MVSQFSSLFKTLNPICLFIPSTEYKTSSMKITTVTVKLFLVIEKSGGLDDAWGSEYFKFET